MPCPNTSAGSVIKCLNQLFILCGTPNYIHSDRGSAFLSQELKEFLTRRGVATSKTTPYHPSGNGQCECYNGIIWKSVLLALKSQQLALTQWELVLPNVLHSIRSLLSTSTNTTPGLGSSTVHQVLKYTKYPKYIPSTSTGQVLIFLKVLKYILYFHIKYNKYSY